MDGWPEYWERMVPMHYATHVVSPCLGLVDGQAEYVSCFGSGAVREELQRKSGNRFAVESCHIKLKDSDVACHVWRVLFDTARQYRESFDVYGTKQSFEWTLVAGEEHVLHTAKKPEPEIAARVSVPDFADRLPESIRGFSHAIQDAEHRSFIQGGGHGGSHPHLVHEFLRRCSKTANLGRMPSRPPIGRASASAPTNPRCGAARLCICRSGLGRGRKPGSIAENSLVRPPA